MDVGAAAALVARGAAAVVSTQPAGEHVDLGNFVFSPPNIGPDFLNANTGAVTWLEADNSFNSTFGTENAVRRINCVHFARARAMEVNYPLRWDQGTIVSDIRANSIVRFTNQNGGIHDVFVEHVVMDANERPTHVVFTDGNWRGRADGDKVVMPFDRFTTIFGGLTSVRSF